MRMPPVPPLRLTVLSPLEAMTALVAISNSSLALSTTALALESVPLLTRSLPVRLIVPVV